MDELNLYDDLDEFHEEQAKKSKELQDLEEKYAKALEDIQSLEEEKKGLHKKIHRMELSFQSLLDTARREINRKDKDIETLRKEKDDICFRRKFSNRPQGTKDVVADEKNTVPALSKEKYTPKGNNETEEDSAKHYKSESVNRRRDRSSESFVGESYKRHRPQEDNDSHYHKRHREDRSHPKSLESRRHREPHQPDRDRDYTHRKERNTKTDYSKHERSRQRHQHQSRRAPSRSPSRDDRTRSRFRRYWQSSPSSKRSSSRIEECDVKSIISRSSKHFDDKEKSHKNSHEKPEKAKECKNSCSRDVGRQVANITLSEKNLKPPTTTIGCNDVGNFQHEFNVFAKKDSKISHIPLAASETIQNPSPTKHRICGQDHFSSQKKDSLKIALTKPQHKEKSLTKIVNENVSNEKTSSKSQESQKSVLEQNEKLLLEEHLYENINDESELASSSMEMQDILYGNLDCGIDKDDLKNHNDEDLRLLPQKTGESEAKKVYTILDETLPYINGESSDSCQRPSSMAQNKCELFENDKVVNKSAASQQNSFKGVVNISEKDYCKQKTNPTLAYTPRKVALFDGIFGTSPSSGGSTDTNKSLANKIVDFLRQSENDDSTSTVLEHANSTNEMANVQPRKFDPTAFEKCFIANTNKTPNMIPIPMMVTPQNIDISNNICQEKSYPSVTKTTSDKSSTNTSPGDSSNGWIIVESPLRKTADDILQQEIDIDSCFAKITDDHGNNKKEERTILDLVKQKATVTATHNIDNIPEQRDYQHLLTNGRTFGWTEESFQSTENHSLNNIHTEGKQPNNLFHSNITCDLNVASSKNASNPLASNSSLSPKICIEGNGTDLDGDMTFSTQGAEEEYIETKRSNSDNQQKATEENSIVNKNKNEQFDEFSKMNDETEEKQIKTKIIKDQTTVTKHVEDGNRIKANAARLFAPDSITLNMEESYSASSLKIDFDRCTSSNGSKEMKEQKFETQQRDKYLENACEERPHPLVINDNKKTQQSENENTLVVESRYEEVLNNSIKCTENDLPETKARDLNTPAKVIDTKQAINRDLEDISVIRTNSISMNTENEKDANDDITAREKSSVSGPPGHEENELNSDPSQKENNHCALADASATKADFNICSLTEVDVAGDQQTNANFRNDSKNDPKTIMATQKGVPKHSLNETILVVGSSIAEAHEISVKCTENYSPETKSMELTSAVERTTTMQTNNDGGKEDTSVNGNKSISTNTDNEKGANDITANEKSGIPGPAVHEDNVYNSDLSQTRNNHSVMTETPATKADFNDSLLSEVDRTGDQQSNANFRNDSVNDPKTIMATPKGVTQHSQNDNILAVDSSDDEEHKNPVKFAENYSPETMSNDLTSPAKRTAKMQINNDDIKDKSVIETASISTNTENEKDTNDIKAKENSSMPGPPVHKDNVFNSEPSQTRNNHSAMSETSATTNDDLEEISGIKIQFTSTNAENEKYTNDIEAIEKSNSPDLFAPEDNVFDSDTSQTEEFLPETNEVIFDNSDTAANTENEKYTNDTRAIEKSSSPDLFASEDKNVLELDLSQTEEFLPETIEVISNNSDTAANSNDSILTIVNLTNHQQTNEIIKIDSDNDTRSSLSPGKLSISITNITVVDNSTLQPKEMVTTEDYDLFKPRNIQSKTVIQNCLSSVIPKPSRGKEPSAFPAGLDDSETMQTNESIRNESCDFSASNEPTAAVPLLAPEDLPAASRKNSKLEPNQNKKTKKSAEAQVPNVINEKVLDSESNVFQTTRSKESSSGGSKCINIINNDTSIHIPGLSLISSMDVKIPALAKATDVVNRYSKQLTSPLMSEPALGKTLKLIADRRLKNKENAKEDDALYRNCNELSERNDLNSTSVITNVCPSKGLNETVSVSRNETQHKHNDAVQFVSSIRESNFFGNSDITGPICQMPQQQQAECSPPEYIPGLDLLQSSENPDVSLRPSSQNKSISRFSTNNAGGGGSESVIESMKALIVTYIPPKKITGTILIPGLGLLDTPMQRDVCQRRSPASIFNISVGSQKTNEHVVARQKSPLPTDDSQIEKTTEVPSTPESVVEGREPQRIRSQASISNISVESQKTNEHVVARQKSPLPTDDSQKEKTAEVSSTPELGVEARKPQRSCISYTEPLEVCQHRSPASISNISVESQKTNEHVVARQKSPLPTDDSQKEKIAEVSITPELVAEGREPQRSRSPASISNISVETQKTNEDVVARQKSPLPTDDPQKEKTTEVSITPELGAEAKEPQRIRSPASISVETQKTNEDVVAGQKSTLPTDDPQKEKTTEVSITPELGAEGREPRRIRSPASISNISVESQKANEHVVAGQKSPLPTDDPQKEKTAEVSITPELGADGRERLRIRSPASISKISVETQKTNEDVVAWQKSPLPTDDPQKEKTTEVSITPELGAEGREPLRIRSPASISNISVESQITNKHVVAGQKSPLPTDDPQKEKTAEVLITPELGAEGRERLRIRSPASISKISVETQKTNEDVVARQKSPLPTDDPQKEKTAEVSITPQLGAEGRERLRIRSPASISKISVETQKTNEDVVARQKSTLPTDDPQKERTTEVSSTPELGAEGRVPQRSCISYTEPLTLRKQKSVIESINAEEKESQRPQVTETTSIEVENIKNLINVTNANFLPLHNQTSMYLSSKTSTTNNNNKLNEINNNPEIDKSKHLGALQNKCQDNSALQETRVELIFAPHLNITKESVPVQYKIDQSLKASYQLNKATIKTVLEAPTSGKPTPSNASESSLIDALNVYSEVMSKMTLSGRDTTSEKTFSDFDNIINFERNLCLVEKSSELFVKGNENLKKHFDKHESSLMSSPNKFLNPFIVTTPKTPKRNAVGLLKTNSATENCGFANNLPSVSTKCPTPPNFSGIFSKISRTDTCCDEHLVYKIRSPHGKTFIIPAASVLCNVDNLQNAAKASKKLHWEMLENKNEMRQLEVGFDANNSDEGQVARSSKEDLSASEKTTSILGMKSRKTRKLNVVSVASKCSEASATCGKPKGLQKDLKRKKFAIPKRRNNIDTATPPLSDDTVEQFRQLAIRQQSLSSNELTRCEAGVTKKLDGNLKKSLPGLKPSSKSDKPDDKTNEQLKSLNANLQQVLSPTVKKKRGRPPKQNVVETRNEEKREEVNAAIEDEGERVTDSKAKKQDDMDYEQNVMEMVDKNQSHLNPKDPQSPLLFKPEQNSAIKNYKILKLNEQDNSIKEEESLNCNSSMLPKVPKVLIKRNCWEEYYHTTERCQKSNLKAKEEDKKCTNAVKERAKHIFGESRSRTPLPHGIEKKSQKKENQIFYNATKNECYREKITFKTSRPVTIMNDDVYGQCRNTLTYVNSRPRRKSMYSLRTNENDENDFCSDTLGRNQRPRRKSFYSAVNSIKADCDENSSLLSSDETTKQNTINKLRKSVNLQRLRIVDGSSEEDEGNYKQREKLTQTKEPKTSKDYDYQIKENKHKSKIIINDMHDKKTPETMKTNSNGAAVPIDRPNKSDNENDEQLYDQYMQAQHEFLRLEKLVTAKHRRKATLDSDSKTLNDGKTFTKVERKDAITKTIFKDTEMCTMMDDHNTDINRIQSAKEQGLGECTKSVKEKHPSKNVIKNVKKEKCALTITVGKKSKNNKINAYDSAADHSSNNLDSQKRYKMLSNSETSIHDLGRYQAGRKSLYAESVASNDRETATEAPPIIDYNKSKPCEVKGDSNAGNIKNMVVEANDLSNKNMTNICSTPACNLKPIKSLRMLKKSKANDKGSPKSTKSETEQKLHNTDIASAKLKEADKALNESTFTKNHPNENDHKQVDKFQEQTLDSNVFNTPLKHSKTKNLKRRILDTSGSECEMEKFASPKLQTVIANPNKISDFGPVKVIAASRKRRIVKVLSTSIKKDEQRQEQLAKNLKSTPDKFEKSTSASPCHSIFYTQVSVQSPFNMTTLSSDDRYNEIDSELQDMFQSPQHDETESVVVPAVEDSPKTVNTQDTQTNDISKSLTLDETTVCTNRENDAASSVNDSKSLSSSASPDKSTAKHLSLGSSEYRFEKVSENVVNLFISRKRKRRNKPPTTN